MKNHFVAVRWNDGTTLLSESCDLASAQRLRSRVAGHWGLRTAIFQLRPVSKPVIVRMFPSRAVSGFGIYRMRVDQTFEHVLDAQNEQQARDSLVARIKEEGVALI